MFLAYKLFYLELKRSCCWKYFLDYRKLLVKRVNNSLRVKFLENCLKANIIPNFLKFRIPTNGCFDEKSVHDFQLRLLRKEVYQAKGDLTSTQEKLTVNRNALKQRINAEMIPSIILHTRHEVRKTWREVSERKNKKLLKLSQEQDSPLFNVQNTVMCFNLTTPPPKYVMETLALGPRNSTLGRFDQKDILSELDDLIRHCRDKNIEEELITDINVKTLTYIKRCKKQKSPRNLLMTRKYLNENELIAVPFDKGIGICIMKSVDYESKLKDIISLAQFEKVLPKRRNEKHPVIKEEERIVSVLKKLKSEGKITEQLYEKLKPIGSQPPRLYGLAKVHKSNVPVRPVLSMPGSAYFKIANQVATWLSVVNECKINSSTKGISDMLPDVKIKEGHEMVSFDVTSLYTNVPLLEAIDECTNLLFSGKYQKPPVDRETFHLLTVLCSCNVIMLTNDGLYRQTDGLAMGSPPAPLLANGWLRKFDDTIKGDADVYTRYMDDILRDISSDDIDDKLVEINSLHPSLKFTIEREVDSSIPFLDMRITRSGDTLQSTWYTKPTDTGLTMNYHALAPTRYKKSVVIGFIHRIFYACSSWKTFHESLVKAKSILQRNQYPESFYEPIIKKTLTKIIENRRVNQSENEVVEDESDEEDIRKIVFVGYRGKVSDDFEKCLQRINAPVKMIFTINKLRNCLPSLKPPVEMFLKSGVVYKISCPRCLACYVGQTSRHLQFRFREHKRGGPVGNHVKQCCVELTKDDITILNATTKSVVRLMTMEALLINEIKPSLNTKDEYRSRSLVIKI